LWQNWVYISSIHSPVCFWLHHVWIELVARYRQLFYGNVLKRDWDSVWGIEKGLCPSLKVYCDGSVVWSQIPVVGIKLVTDVLNSEKDIVLVHREYFMLERGWKICVMNFNIIHSSILLRWFDFILVKSVVEREE